MGDLVQFTRPDVAPLRVTATALERDADALDVTDTDTDAAALEIVKAARAAERIVTDRLAPIIDAAHRAHKELTLLRTELLAPIQRAAGTATRKHLDYEARVIREAAEERAMLEAAARLEEEGRRESIAAAVEAAGDTELAEAMRLEPVNVPVPHVPVPTAQVAGVTARGTWRAEVVDLAALIRWVAANPEWRNLLLPNTVALNAIARSQRGAFSIAGCRAVQDRGLAVRR